MRHLFKRQHGYDTPTRSRRSLGDSGVARTFFTTIDAEQPAPKGKKETPGARPPLAWRAGAGPAADARGLSRSEGEGMRLAYDEPEWCAGKLWKWDCFFLPVTNCTVPPEMVLALKDSHQSEGFKGTVTWDGGKPLGEQLETVCEESVCAALETDARTTPYNGNFAQQFLIRPNYRTRREVMRIKREVTGRAGGPGALDAGRCVKGVCYSVVRVSLDAGRCVAVHVVSLKFTD